MGISTGPCSPLSLTESGEASPKRQKLEPEEVYVVLRPRGLAFWFHYIYIVDLNEKEHGSSLVRRNPAIRVTEEFPVGMAVAVFNSSVYMFGGLNRDWLTDSYCYHIRSRLTPHSETLDINVSNGIRSISSMEHKKSEPRAVLIGEQICVFSRRLSRDTQNFELYDPHSDKWSSVPEPPIDYANLPRSFCGVEYCEMGFYCIENLALFISTVRGTYSIDLGQPRNDRKWVECNLPPYRMAYRNTQHFLKDGNLLVTPSFDVYDLNNSFKQQPPAISSNIVTEVLKSQDEAIFLLPKKEERYTRACIFYAGGPTYFDVDWKKDSALWFYLFEFDDNNIVDDDAKTLNPTIINSRLCNLDCGIETYKIQIEGVFPL